MTGYIFLTLLTLNLSLGGSERERKQRSTQRILQKSSIHCRLGKCRPYYRGICRPSPSSRGLGFERDRVHRWRRSGWYVIYSSQLLFVRPQNNFLFFYSHTIIGSIVATIQSIFYGGLTTGIFSIFQSIGATAVLPGATAVAGASTALGAGVSSLIKMQRSLGDDGQGGCERGEDDATVACPPSPPNIVRSKSL